MKQKFNAQTGQTPDSRKGAVEGTCGLGKAQGGFAHSGRQTAVNYSMLYAFLSFYIHELS